MNFRHARRSHAETEVSFIPLIDVFLNILVFFLIATSFSSSSLFDIQVPEAKTGQSAAGIESLRIAVDKNGNLYLDDKSVSKDQLTEQLKTIPARERSGKSIAMQADKKAMHGSVVGILDLLRSLGFDKVSLLTQEGP